MRPHHAQLALGTDHGAEVQANPEGIDVHCADDAEAFARGNLRRYRSTNRSQTVWMTLIMQEL
jgi:hypothetical protein